MLGTIQAITRVKESNRSSRRDGVETDGSSNSGGDIVTEAEHGCLERFVFQKIACRVYINDPFAKRGIFWNRQ